MSRLGQTLLAISSFLVVLAVLFPAFVHERVLSHPVDPALTVHLEGEQATVFDTATLRPRSGVSLVQTVALSGDRGMADDRTAVWTEFATLNLVDGERVDYRQRRLAFDRRTAMPVECCGAYPARSGGLAFRWPIGAERRDYPLADPVTGQSFPARYQGEEQLRGLTVYRYAQTVPRTFTGQQLMLPRSVTTMPGRGEVELDRHTAITRTLWVEPVSGIPVKVSEQRVDLLLSDGWEALTLLSAELTTPEADVDRLAGAARPVVLFSSLVRTVLPIVFGVAGLALILLALRPRRSAPAQDEQQVPADDLSEAGDADDPGGPARVVAGKRVDDLDE